MIGNQLGGTLKKPQKPLKHDITENRLHDSGNGIFRGTIESVLITQGLFLRLLPFGVAGQRTVRALPH